MHNIRKGEYKMEVFHVGDKVFLDNVECSKYYKKIAIDTEGNQKVSLGKIENYQYGKVIAINTEDNLMAISPINELGMIFNVHMDLPHIHKIDFLPNDNVIIHDLMKKHYNERGVISAYDWRINRYRVLINNKPCWYNPFELTLEDNLEDDNDKNKYFAVPFSSFNPIKVTLSDKGKKAYEYHFGIKPSVDANGRTEFTNLAQFIEAFDPTFIYGDKYKYMIEDDKIFVKVD